MIPSIRSLEGILTMWDSRFATRVDMVKRRFSLSILLNIKGKDGDSQMSMDLLVIEGGFFSGRKMTSLWCLGGDANACQFP